MSRKACPRVSSSPAQCPCEAKHCGWKTISGVLSGYSDLANVGTLSATSGDMREAGATTPILHLSLLIQATSLHCTSSATLLDFANVPTERLLFLRRGREWHAPARFDHSS